MACDDLGLADLLEHGLASGVGVHLELRRRWGAGSRMRRPRDCRTYSPDGHERLGVGCAKRAGERLDRLCGWLLAAHDDGGLAVLEGVEPAQGAEVGGLDVRRQIVDRASLGRLVGDQQDVAGQHLEQVEHLRREGCGLAASSSG